MLAEWPAMKQTALRHIAVFRLQALDKIVLYLRLGPGLESCYKSRTGDIVGNGIRISIKQIVSLKPPSMQLQQNDLQKRKDKTDTSRLSLLPS